MRRRRKRRRASQEEEEEEEDTIVDVVEYVCRPFRARFFFSPKPNRANRRRAPPDKGRRGGDKKEAFADLPDTISRVLERIEELDRMNPGGGGPRNPNQPELPFVEGDFDWDAKYANDDDWETDPSKIPGKQVLNDVELARQVTALSKLEEKWRRQSEAAQFEESRLVGFTQQAEILNGRTAMFFLVVGLLTELWTGVDMPGQVEEFLRITGVLGLE